jgi:hypothetical protein
MDWRSEGHTQIGETVEGVRYYFHGLGVTVHLPDYVVDFDFGFDGRANGFSPWKLADFARQLGPRFEELQQWQQVQALLIEAEQNGDVGQPFLSRQDDLFYLAGRA